ALLRSHHRRRRAALGDGLAPRRRGDRSGGRREARRAPAVVHRTADAAHLRRRERVGGGRAPVAPVAQVTCAASKGSPSAFLYFSPSRTSSCRRIEPSPGRTRAVGSVKARNTVSPSTEKRCEPTTWSFSVSRKR